MSNRPHVKIAATEQGAWAVELDGIDISRSLIGLSVRIGTAEIRTIGGKATHYLRDAEVTLELSAASVDIDLPAALVEAFRAEEGDR